MQPIETKVSNVQIFPYIPDAPIVVPPVFVNGSGTYSVGTLTSHAFYNLDLTSGRMQNGGVQAGQRYYATFPGANGEQVTTPWMHATRGGEQPQLARTIDMLGGTIEPAAGSSDIAYQLHLTDVYVSLHHDPREPIEIPLIEGGTAVATFAGLLPGGSWSVSVSGGQRVNPLRVGSAVNIRGKLINTEKPYSIPAVLVTTDAGDPAVFNQKLR